MPAAIDTTQNLPLKKRYSQILNASIANGDASGDTVKTYTQQFKLFVAWCDRVGLRLEAATEEDILDYRRYLVDRGLKKTTIALKLTVIRRIFEIAVERGLMASNPALRVKAPTERRDPAEHDNYLELEEAQKLVESLPVENTVKGLRDRLLVCLMVIQGCRQIGLYRLNVGDIIRRRGQIGLKIRAKGSVRVVPLTDDVAKLLDRYLKIREAEEGRKLRKDEPMFVSLSRNSAGRRLGRRSMERIVDEYLELAELKYTHNRTVTAHGLRHTVGYLLTSLGRPLREVQEALGHSDPRTTAIYAHIVSLWDNNPFTRLAIAI